MAQTHSLDLEKYSSQYASITDASQTGLDITGDMTIEAWVRLESIGTQEHTLVSKWATANNRSYKLSVTNTVLNFSTSATGILETNASISYTFQTGVWYHIAVTKSGTTATFYVNGRNIGTSTVDSIIFNSSSAFIVGAIGDPNNYFDGLIKDVRVFNDARTQAEIVADAHTENVSDANLQGEWNFNNNYNDTSGNGNNLTANNSPVFVTTIPCEFPNQIVNTYFETNLKAYWELDGDATDSTSGGYNGTAGADVNYTTGKQNQAMTQTDGGSTRGINVGSPSGLDLTSYPVTIMGWLKTTADFVQENSLMTILNNTKTSPPYSHVHLTMSMGTSSGDRGKIEWVYRNSSGTTSKITSPEKYNDGNWHHAVGTIDASGKMYLYVDGIEVGSNTATGNLSTGKKVTIGTNWNVNTSNVWVGELDEVAIWFRSLEYGEVLDLYAGGAGIPYEASGSAYTQELTETVNASDNALLKTSKNLTESITAGINLALNTGKTLLESIAATATAATSLILTKQLTESITAGVTTTAKITVKYINESITATASILRNTHKTIIESITANDTIANLLLFTISLAESIATNITTTAKITAKTLTESISVTSLVDALKTYNRAFTESISTNATINNIKTAYKTLTESINTNVTITRILTATISFTESIKTRARIYGLLNGVNMLWHNKYVDKVGIWINKYLDNK